MKKQPRPFAFSDNLKVFMIILLILPIIGFIVSIFLNMDGSVKVIASDIVTVDKIEGVDIKGAIEFAKSGGGKIEGEHIITLNTISGNPQKSAVLNPLGLPEGDKYYLFFPFWDYTKSNTVGIKVLVFDIGHSMYTGDEIAENSDVEMSQKAMDALEDGFKLTLFKFGMQKTEEFYLTYNYSLRELSYGFGGRPPEFKIIEFDFNFVEDYATDRYRNTLFSSCNVLFKEGKTIPEEFMTIRSATTPIIYKAQKTSSAPNQITMFTEVGAKDDIELGVKFALKFEGGYDNFDKISFDVFSSAEDVFDPLVNLRVIYKEALPKNYMEELQEE